MNDLYIFVVSLSCDTATTIQPSYASLQRLKHILSSSHESLFRSLPIDNLPYILHIRSLPIQILNIKLVSAQSHAEGNVPASNKHVPTYQPPE
jgi:hypothetical protein